ncbi:hypothetical protein [Butyrivibrio sp. TB]|nr:hypothetical protein [Butyrivibrio sp. TB]SEQ25377.1 hypothetical protein SAMN02910382_02470 [Butyrivibrio sp. TB]
MPRYFSEKLLFILVYLSFILSERVTDSNKIFGRVSLLIESVKLKYIIIVAAILWLILIYFRKNHHRILFKTETQYIAIYIAVLSFITLLQQMRNGFFSYSILEIVFLVVPILFVFLLLNCSKTSVNKYVDIAFIIQYIVFLSELVSLFSLKMLQQIDFISSYSPLESDLAFYGVVFTAFYSYKDEKVKMLLSVFMTFISLKRLALLFCLLFVLVNIIKPNMLYTGRPSNKTILVISTIFVMCPVLISVLVSDQMLELIYKVTNISLNELTLGRIDRIKLCLNNDIQYGLGTTTVYLSNVMNNDISRNLHNDILRIYIECTFIGSVFFTYCNFKITRRSFFSLLLMIYLFTDMIFNHFLGAGRTFFWIIVYLTINYFNSNNIQKGNIKLFK